MIKNNQEISFTLDDVGTFLAKFTENSDNTQVYWISSPDFKKIQFVSPAYEVIWGRSREELYKKPEIWITFLHPDDVPQEHPLEVVARDIKRLGDKARYTRNYRIIRPDGEIRWIMDKGFPIFDSNGHCYGVTGIAIDITNQKRREEELVQAKEAAEMALQAVKQAQVEQEKHRQEAEKLNLENTAHLAKIEAQDQFTKLANQVAHDIRSPLASMLMIVKACKEIPERERIALRSASMRISDIANNLLSQYKLDKTESTTETEDETPHLLSATLLQLITEKKFQYQDFAVTFENQFDPQAQFAFISIEPTAFKRMISNLINNGVDSFENKPGSIVLKLQATKELATIIIEDNGKGMSPTLIQKIMNNQVVTEGKHGGHGIGLIQVRETLSRSGGKLKIQSKIGQGTQVSVQFPRIKAPSWIAEEINLDKKNIMVILDDDNSIHGAWDSRFKPIIAETPNIQLHHFEEGKQALDFIASVPEQKKKNILLLTDYELLKQKLNGLDVVKKSNITSAILVTSHYDDPLIQKQALALGTTILPKQLASEIPICFNTQAELILNRRKEPGVMKQVDAIIVDDDTEYLETLENYVFDEKDMIEYFTEPDKFEQLVTKYPPYTRIFLDNNFTLSNKKMKGLDLAKRLHERGYTNLRLLTGEQFHPQDIPEYLTVILKTDFDKIKDW